MKVAFLVDATSIEAYHTVRSRSWGWDVRANVVFIENNPWIAIFPGRTTLITVLGCNLFGDGLRDALDPYLKQ